MLRECLRRILGVLPRQHRQQINGSGKQVISGAPSLFDGVEERASRRGRVDESVQILERQPAVIKTETSADQVASYRRLLRFEGLVDLGDFPGVTPPSSSHASKNSSNFSPVRSKMAIIASSSAKMPMYLRSRRS